jgi:hypothetical protein
MIITVAISISFLSSCRFVNFLVMFFPFSFLFCCIGSVEWLFLNPFRFPKPFEHTQCSGLNPLLWALYLASSNCFVYISSLLPFLSLVFYWGFLYLERELRICSRRKRRRRGGKKKGSARKQTTPFSSNRTTQTQPAAQTTQMATDSGFGPCMHVLKDSDTAQRWPAYI